MYKCDDKAAETLLASMRVQCSPQIDHLYPHIQIVGSSNYPCGAERENACHFLTVSCYRKKLAHAINSETGNGANDTEPMYEYKSK